MHWFLFQGYLFALGRKRVAEVQTEARIGQAIAKMQSGIKVSDLSVLGVYQQSNK